MRLIILVIGIVVAAYALFQQLQGRQQNSYVLVRSIVLLVAVVVVGISLML